MLRRTNLLEYYVYDTIHIITMKYLNIYFIQRDTGRDEDVQCPLEQNKC